MRFGVKRLFPDTDYGRLCNHLAPSKKPINEVICCRLNRFVLMKVKGQWGQLF